MIRTLLIALSLVILAAPLCRGQYAVQQQQSVGMGGYGAALGQAPVLAAPVGGCAVGAAVQAAPLYQAPVVQQAPVVLQAAPAYMQQAPVVVQAAPAYVQAAPVVVQQAPVYVQRQALVGGYGYGVGAGVGRGVAVGHGLVGRAAVAPVAVGAGNQRIKQKQKTVIRPARRGLFGRL
jgi:hypothetical protein